MLVSPQCCCGPGYQEPLRTSLAKSVRLYLDSPTGMWGSHDRYSVGQMGDQPRPVEDEVERALASMRAGFLSGSEQITTGITSLDEHLQNTPPSEALEAVRATVSRLATAHELLIAKVAHLPASSWDSFKVLVSAVKTQQIVLDEVSHLVKEHVLPRQLESLSAPPFPAAPGPEEELDLAGEDARRPHESYLPHDALRSHDGAFSPHDVHAPRDSFLPHTGIHGHEAFPADEDYPAGDGFPGNGRFRHGDGYNADESLPLPVAFRPQADAGFHANLHTSVPARPDRGFRVLAEAGLRARDDDRPRARHERRRPVHDDDTDDDTERVSFFTLARERTAGFRGLAAMIAVGVILSVFPRDKLQDAASKLIDLVGPGGPATVADEAPRSGSPSPAGPRSNERVPSASPGVEASPENRAAQAAAVAAPQAREEMRQVTVSPESRTAAEPVRVAAVTPARAPVAAAAAAPAEAEERFVPVVFTHRDHATVMRALADLKHQYPNVLVGHEGEVQPVDMGKKGIWHRLVFLPAGPRPEAAKVCNELAARGYDRCWVRGY
ncbi:MAG TPA: hypothetical protein VFZ16_05795 [Hyphomicrobiaceae bacterium]|nr:hypothetical protein [Hyphomicrobiaceae bacterium]